MTKNGRKVHIVLDDFIPCKDYRPAFSSANGNELWVLLLEKAWAKLHGSYDRIISGYAHETMRDLTGAPAFEYQIKDNKDSIFAKIEEAKNYDWAIAAGCDAKSEDEKAKLKELGLVGEHSYGIIGVYTVTDAEDVET